MEGTLRSRREQLNFLILRLTGDICHVSSKCSDMTCRPQWQRRQHDTFRQPR